LALLLWSLAISGVVVFQHRGNIRRLLSGTERRLGERVS
jgi:glycerol-3-phosphate acyltransferase PlsY